MKRIEHVGRAERVICESSIVCSVNLDGAGKTDISTGLPPFDHMLIAFGLHGSFDLTVHANGDTEVDAHHTVEDTGIVMGQAFAQALGDKSGICRSGDCYIPMDEMLAHTTVSVSGRPHFVGTGEPEQMLTVVTGGHYVTVTNEHFFESLALNARIALHARCLYGHDPYYITEVEYKAVVRALRAAVKGDPRVHGALPAKGTLQVAAEVDGYYRKLENLPWLAFQRNRW